MVFLNGTCERKPCNFTHPRLNAKQKQDMLKTLEKAKGKGKSSKKDAAPGAQRSSSQNSQRSNGSKKSHNSQNSEGSQPRSTSRRRGRKGAKALASVPPPPKPTQERDRKPKAKAKAAPASHLRYCDAFLTQAGCPRHATGECTLWHVSEEVKTEMIAQERRARQALKTQN